MANLTWKTPLWKMQITDQQYADLKKALNFAFRTKDKQRINALAREAALFCAEWWRREHIEGHPSRYQVVKGLGLEELHKKKFFDLAYEGLKQLKINPVKITNEHKFRTLLLQGGLPIAKIKNSGDAINGYQRFLTGLIRYTKNISINWDDHAFIKSLNCFTYLPQTFRNEGIYELSLLIANAIISDNDELLPYDVTEEYWKAFTFSLKQSAQSISYKVPFIVNWKATKVNGSIQLFYTLECAKKISETFVDENNLGDCYSFSVYINNKFAASYALTHENIFIIRDSRNVLEKWHGEPVVNFYLKTEDNRIIELTAPSSTAPDFDNPILLGQSDEKDQIWEIKSSTRGNSKNATVYPEFWIIKDIPACHGEMIKLRDLELKWVEFSETIELKNINTGEVCVFDENESAFKYQFINWKTDWIIQSNFKVLTHEPVVRVYDENQEKIASNKFSVFYKEYRSSNWEKFGEKELPVGLLEFKIIYPDGKFGKEKFFYTGPLGLDYIEMDVLRGLIQWNWNSGKIYSLSNQNGLKINESNKLNWQIKRENNGALYPEKVGFLLEPITTSPGLEVYVATPFKGIIIIDENGEEISPNRIISSSALYTYRYVVMGYERVKTKIFHLANSKVVIKGELKQGINALSRFDDDIKKLFDLQGSETFLENSVVRIVIGDVNNRKSIDVRDFNLYTKHAGSFNGIQVVNNRNEKQVVDFKGKLQAVSVDCTYEDIQVVDFEKTENGFVFNDECKLEKFIAFTDKYNNNGSTDLIVPRYFDYTLKFDLPTDESISELSPQENNILFLKSTLEEASAMDDEWKKVHKYFLIAVNHQIPFKTFNHLRAAARTPELLAKLVISMGQSAEIVKALPRERMINELVSFERELSFGWHWLNVDFHWNTSIDWYLSGLPNFLQNDIWLKAYSQIKELLDHSLFNQNQGLINRLLSENCTPSVSPPSNAEVNEIRSKLGANQNYPENLVFIPDEWTILFPKALNNGIPIFVRSFLFSPVKAALAFMGKDLSVWSDENFVTRRVINFYRQLKPNEYLSLFENMVCQIKNKKI